MAGKLIHNATFDSQTRILSLLDRAGDVISSCEVPSKELVDDPNKPLMLRSLENASSVMLKKNGTLSNTYQTSTNGKDWTDYTLGTEISLNKGESVYFRCSNHPTTQSGSNYVRFFMAGKIEAWHNAYSMISSSFTNTGESVGDYGMARLFDGCEGLTKAPLLLNALAEHCYDGLFYACPSLKQAPSLPATTLADGCYRGMFAYCSNLKEVRISATTTATDALAYWLSGVSETGDFYCDPNATIFLTDSTSGIPKGWRRIPPVDDPSKPLMLRAIEDNSSVTLKKHGEGALSNTYQTSTDGTNWTDYTLGTQISLNRDEYVYFRCSNHPTRQTAYDYVYFSMTGKIEAWHNAYSMISSDFSSAEGSVGDYGMDGLFEYCTSLIKAPLLLNALSPHCYLGTFFECRYLTQAPALPATTLEKGCYQSMFTNCRSLTQAPTLPAATLKDFCYCNMLSGCSKLKEVRISATTTASNAMTNWLDGVSATGDFYCDPNATIFPTGASGIPSGWRRIPPVDDPSKPLTFKATQDGSTVTLTQKGSPSGAFQTSRDGGKTWVDYTIDTAITLSNGDEVSFRAKANRSSAQTAQEYFYFTMTGKIEAWHNVMSLYRTNDFATYESVVPYAFAWMFVGCASLTKAPLLPATTLADSCYWAMFWGTSLTKAPELPATALAPDCYYDMFRWCQSLTKAPELPATELESRCYCTMFQGCLSLNEVRISATTTATDALAGWLNNVSATGDFYCDPNATIFPTGSDGCPSGWTRLNINDYPTT